MGVHVYIQTHRSVKSVVNHSGNCQLYMHKYCATCLKNRQLYTPYGPFRLFVINDLTGYEKSVIIMYNLDTLKVYHLTTI